MGSEEILVALNQGVAEVVIESVGVHVLIFDVFRSQFEELSSGFLSSVFHPPIRIVEPIRTLPVIITVLKIVPVVVVVDPETLPVVVVETSIVKSRRPIRLTASL